MALKNNLEVDYGKLPPQAIEIEEALLGKLLIESDTFFQLSERLEPRFFYKEQHGKIYQAMMDLAEENNPVDMITVMNQLRKKDELEEAGGAYYLSQLTSKVASAINAEYYTMVVIQKFIAREIIFICGKAQQQSYDEGSDISDIIGFISSKLSTIDDVIISGKPLVSISENIQLAIGALQERGKAHNERGLYGITTGLGCLNEKLNGFQNSDLIIIAARPSVGKTALSLHMAKMAAKRGTKVLYFSAEMSSLAVTTRLIMGETNISPEKFTKGNFESKDWQELEDNLPELLRSHLIIDDKASMNTLHIQNVVRKLVREQQIELIFIDYLQYIRYVGSYEGDRVNEVGQMSREFKNLAKEYDIPVILMSQLNRDKEKRSDRQSKPKLSDLRNSGDIEQDADVVLLLDRDIYADQEHEETREMDIILAKNRNGAVGEFTIYHSKGLARFSDMRESEQQAMAGMNNIPYEPNKNDLETDVPY